jgi:hypothetical protein
MVTIDVAPKCGCRDNRDDTAHVGPLQCVSACLSIDVLLVLSIRANHGKFVAVEIFLSM